MKHKFFLKWMLIGFLLPALTVQSQSQTKIWQETITLPTYQVDQPDPNPRFYDGRVTQGAQGRVYPYAMSDVLLSQKVDEVYDIIYLENEFVKISVIPRLGGRIFTAVDKTNNYDFFYRQSVIKPALIGTLGKWISGGSEWNFPHHHKATTMMRMDFHMEQNEDGSATLWLAETERRHRFRITLSMTLYPDRSYLEMDVIPYNTTPFVHSFLYFANPAVHVDSTYQVIFPPNVEYVTQHAKREFIQWPIANGTYGGKSYDDVDISWWKNLATPVSFFAWNDEQDFFAGYDHGKEAGVAYLADHHTAPGMKFFTFGSGKSGAAWDKRLTDSDGPYLELMAGVFSDNQPDYSWAQPYERKSATQFWFPVRDLGGMNYANLNGAIYLNTAHLPDVKIHMNATRIHKNAKMVLVAKDQQLWETGSDIGPDQPFSAELRLQEDFRPTDLKLTLYTNDGSLLMSYQPEDKKGSEMPVEVIPPPSPDQIASVEELYLTGLRLNQFYNAYLDPMPYYLEALKRDPGNYLVNTQLGILACQEFKWEEAGQRLKTALDRITYNHTRPRDGEAWYYLGITLRGQGKMKEAYDAFNRSSWSHAWHAASYYQLAEMDCLVGNFNTALDHINRSISTNTGNLKAKNLKSVILRKLGDTGQAHKLALSVSHEDPLDLMSRNELLILASMNDEKLAMAQAKEELESIMMMEVETTIELAAGYGNCGSFQEGIDILSQLDITREADGSRYPMLYYYMSYYHDLMGNRESSGEYGELASSMPFDYCFPYRMESLGVLEHAILKNPGDANALYYLGNMLFDHQPEKARSYWEKALEIDASNPVLYRNLGLASATVDSDYEKAVKYYEDALKIRLDPRIIYELDILYEKINADNSKREALFEKNNSVVHQRVDALTRQVLFNIQLEKYDTAIALLQNNHFYLWEGGDDVRVYYEDAHLLRGISFMGSGENDKALADFLAAQEYPENLEEGRPEFDRRFAQSYYYLALALELSGNQTVADTYFQKAANERTGNSEFLFYNIMACKKLGDLEQADTYLAKLKEFAERGSGDRFFAKFGEKQSELMKQAEQYYLEGLVGMASGNAGDAGKAFRKAIELNPNYAWAKAHLGEISE